MKRKRKLKPWVIPTIIIMMILTIPSTYAFYFSDYESSIISKFTVDADLSNSYVRATVLTYWVDTTSCTNSLDLTTCDISGKSSWKMNDNITNSNWILLEDGFYYYQTNVHSNEINKDNIKTSSIALIDPNLTLEELTNEQLVGVSVVPQYEILYEFITSDAIETAWKVTYTTGLPSLLN